MRKSEAYDNVYSSGLYKILYLNAIPAQAHIDSTNRDGLENEVLYRRWT